MQDEDKTKEQLIIELHELRKRVAESEKDKGASTDPAELRRHAEESLKARQTETDQRETHDTERLHHELEVHQTELEMQNEELRNGLVQIEESRTRYSDLYDFAPVGYLTLDENGLVLEANLTIAQQLGVERSHLVGSPLSAYIVIADRNAFRSHLGSVLKDKTHQACEVRFMKESGGDFHTLVDTIFVMDAVGEGRVRTSVTDITGRKRAEKALRKSEGKYRRIVETANEGICVADVDYLFTYVNQKMADMLGYLPEEIIGKPLVHFLFPEDLANHQEKRSHRIEGLNETYERRFRRSDGREYWTKVSATVIRTEDGRFMGSFAMLTDITERKLAEDDLRVSLRFLGILHQHTEIAPLLREYVSEIKNYTGCDAVGIRVLDENLNIPYVVYQGFSRKFYETESPLSLKTDECMCISVIRGDVDPSLPFFTEGGAFCVNATSRFLATVSEEEKGRTRNRCNQEGYETVGLFPFRSGGKIFGLVHVADHRENMLPPNVLEVLEKAALQLGTAFQRAQAEEALRESQQMLQSVMDTIPARVFWKDLDLNYLGCNRPFALDAGLQSPEELIGRNDFEMCWGEQADLYRSDDRLVMETGIAKLGYEEPQTMPDGGRIWLRTSKVPLFDVKGQIKGVLGTYEDITVHKRAEEALQKAHDELELRVKERTAALEKANEELQQIPSKLIAVQEEERKRLASELHDSIGQTLAAVKFWVEMALKFKDAGDGNAALNHLEQFVPILQRSIEETRSIYMGLRPTMLDSKGLLATLEWLRQECMKLYPERHIELEAGIAEEAIPKNLKVNIFRIAQEALNNIAKHSKAEWVDISLSKDGNGIELVVSDDGVGMDLDIIMQTSTATSLGLTSMRERAELTGGSFSIESTPGEGTTIRASWPI
ncbi:MAG: PAS domain S-box protein [Syntrophobacteraceae bacterium]|jgi:PAS domain S-box-containing protein